MMIIFPIFAILSLSILGLAIGVLLGRAPVRGSCGGLCHSGACPRRVTARKKEKPDA